jgi:hypothetical protein
MQKKTKQMPFKFGLCIDWETSGSSWGKDSTIEHQGLSFGAIVFDAETFDPVEELYLEIKFNGEKWKWSKDAENIHGMSQEYLEQNGVDQEEAAMALAQLILKYWGTDSKVLFLGHNPEFDRRFTNQLLNCIDIEFSVEATGKFDSRIEIFHVILDTSALGLVAFGLYKSDLLFEKIGFAERGDHNSLTDAHQTLATCKAIRELVTLGMQAL